MPTGVSQQASIAATAKLGGNVAVGPFTTIGENVVLGNNVMVFQNVSIEAGTTVGDDSIIYPGAGDLRGHVHWSAMYHSRGVIIGADGYGLPCTRGSIIKFRRSELSNRR
jgi:UDP-3-O-[3-hydroxymyristoyl] glucosamine N-acyltransferase